MIYFSQFKPQNEHSTQITRSSVKKAYHGTKSLQTQRFGMLKQKILKPVIVQLFFKEQLKIGSPERPHVGFMLYDRLCVVCYLDPMFITKIIKIIKIINLTKMKNIETSKPENLKT